MTEGELLQELHRLAETDAPGLDALAQAIRQHARDGARVVVGEWLKDTGRQSTNAAVVTRKLHELALHEMLGHAEIVSADLRVRLMTSVLDAAMALRSLILDQVEPLLDNWTPLDPPWSGRARDVAYVLVRRMDGKPRDAAADRAFLAATEDERDAEISAWQDAQAAAKAAEMEF